MNKKGKVDSFSKIIEYGKMKKNTLGGSKSPPGVLAYVKISVYTGEKDV